MKYWIICKENDRSKNAKEILLKSLNLELNRQNPDLVIAIGGDGTFIKAVHQYPSAIFFGLHTGHVGFYANYTLDTIDKLIDDINKNNFSVNKFSTLNVIVRTGEKEISNFAINEMTIIMPPRTLILDVEIDSKKLETFRGTGLCISTPSGSTAYNKSLHGAILDPALNAFQLTEIAGINSNSYRTLSSPLLLDGNKKIVLRSSDSPEIYVTIDNLHYNLLDFKEATITLIPKKIKIAYHEDTHFIERIKRTFL